MDAVKISDNFINNGIKVKMMEFKEKDPSETGFETLLYLINRTEQTKFSDLMRLKLNGKTKKTYGNTMMIGKFILPIVN